MEDEPLRMDATRTTRPLCRVEWLGVEQDYQQTWDLQRRIAAERLAGTRPDTLLLLEHAPTLTLGRAADVGHILADRDTLSVEQISVVESDRGGDVTYHGPGQLVGYPILNLREPPHHTDLHVYLRGIEEMLIRTVEAFGIPAGRFHGNTGVWTGLDTAAPKKVAAIGIKTARWITQHGFALNVAPNLAHFDLIVPCGIHDYGVTSLSRLLDREMSVAETLPVVITHFVAVFGLECVSGEGIARDASEL